MDHIRHVDFKALGAGGDERNTVQSLLGHGSGATTCTISCIRTPVGSGSAAGLHTHTVDQIFYVLSGTMSVEVAGEIHEADAGSLVIFPAGVPHRNWNGGSTPTVHLVFNTPLSDPAQPFAIPVDRDGA